jgi:hypothetical protein
MARNKRLGAPQREVVWLSHASTPHMSENERIAAQSLAYDAHVFPDDADCPSSYSYPTGPVERVQPSIPTRERGQRRALVLNLLGFRVVLMRHSAQHAA